MGVWNAKILQSFNMQNYKGGVPLNNSKGQQKKLSIIPLGGLGEIGKNMTAFVYGNDMILWMPAWHSLMMTCWGSIW